MKKVTKIWQACKAELDQIEKLAGVTPQQKLAICEDAKTLAQAVLTGVWLELALLLIADLEKTIKVA